MYVCLFIYINDVILYNVMIGHIVFCFCFCDCGSPLFVLIKSFTCYFVWNNYFVLGIMFGNKGKVFCTRSNVPTSDSMNLFSNEVCDQVSRCSFFKRYCLKIAQFISELRRQKSTNKFILFPSTIPKTHFTYFLPELKTAISPNVVHRNSNSIGKATSLSRVSVCPSPNIEESINKHRYKNEGSQKHGDSGQSANRPDKLSSPAPLIPLAHAQSCGVCRGVEGSMLVGGLSRTEQPN